MRRPRLPPLYGAVKAPQRTGGCTDLPGLRDRLLAERDFEPVESRDLQSVRSNLESKIPVLLFAGRFVQARNYILLSKDIEATLCDRARKAPPKPPEVPDILARFDSETDCKAKQITNRYSNLDAKLSSVWQSTVKEEYFRPSERVTELRKEAQKYPGDDNLGESLNSLQEDENKMAGLNFEMAVDDARERLWQKQRIELATFFQNRKKQRALLWSQIRTRPYILACKARAMRRTSPIVLAPVVQPTVNPLSRRTAAPLQPRKTFGPPPPDKQTTFVTAAGVTETASSESSDEHDHTIYEAEEFPPETVPLQVQGNTATSSREFTDSESSERAGLMFGSDGQIAIEFQSATSSSLFDVAGEEEEETPREPVMQDAVGDTVTLPSADT